MILALEQALIVDSALSCTDTICFLYKVSLFGVILNFLGSAQPFNVIVLFYVDKGQLISKANFLVLI